MVWEPEIEELKYRKRLAEQLGGPEGIDRQHRSGKLTVRERIAKLADANSFQEIGELAGTAQYKDNELQDFKPSPYVMGLCTINGRSVVVGGGDFTVRGGAGGIHDPAVQKGWYSQNLALEWRLPYVRLLDAAGGSVKSFEEIGRTYVPDNAGAAVGYTLLNYVPVVSAVVGSVAGMPAVEACMAHFTLMVKGTSQVFPGGPPVVKAALGYDINKEDLGGAKVSEQSGVIDRLAKDEDEAFDLIKRFLRYLPDNVWELPPRGEVIDPPTQRAEGLLSIVPRETNKPYNPRALLEMVFDHDSLFEIAPSYGRSRITALARANGYTVGVMINNPNFQGGSMDMASGEKVIRFLQLCDLFHIPLVGFVDEPGFMVGLEAQKQGVVRAGAQVVCATASTKVPWITFIVRQVYGVAGMVSAGLSRPPGNMVKRYAWPSANWGSMHIEGGAMAAYRREIEAAEDPTSKRLEIENRLKALASPFRTAEAFNIEDIIDPRDTRPLLCDFVEKAQRLLQAQLGPRTGPGYMP
ncbi:MAG: carboxyl transferase domain-containing protein [Dehalococcoidia bacterium]|nr:carboxyl transferase domain-containing protein [Dehalococcoidia bacterium]